MEKGNTSRLSKLYTLIILVLLYIAIISFPFTLLVADIYSKIIDMVLKIVFIIVAFISIKRYELNGVKALPDKNPFLFLLIPLFALTFSNWIYIWIFKPSLVTSFDGGLFTLTVFSTLITVFCEELLFREITHNCLKEFVKQDYLRILISSAIFALLHFVNVFGGVDITFVLAQVGYTFVLGLILGLIKEKGAGLIVLTSFHFLFNLLNNDLFSFLYNGDWNKEFIITNVIVGAIAVIYGVLMYFFLKVNSLPLNLKDNSEDEISDTSHKEEN